MFIHHITVLMTHRHSPSLTSHHTEKGVGGKEENKQGKSEKPGKTEER
jgi:hypothetical protein